jgi:hypothetical protein
MHESGSWTSQKRDDMVSWFFSMIELMLGHLPWKSASEKDSILRMKESMSSDQLCQNVPSQFVVIYESLTALNYEEMPDYDMILTQLTEALRELNVGTTDGYDWEALDEQTLSSMSVGPMLKRTVDAFDTRMKVPAVDDTISYVPDQPLLEELPFSDMHENEDEVPDLDHVVTNCVMFGNVAERHIVKLSTRLSSNAV